MKLPPVERIVVDDTNCRARTGRTLKEWYADLDAFGGLPRGRRELVNRVYEACAKDAWWATTIAVEYEKARGQREKDGQPTGYSICSTKTVKAPLAEVFAAFGEASALDRWLGSSTRLEFVEGGRFVDADGDQGMFRRIRPAKDIRLTWERADLAPGTPVEVLFSDKGQGKTGLVLNHTRIGDRHAADIAREFWGLALERLKTSMESR